MKSQIDRETGRPRQIEHRKKANKQRHTEKKYTQHVDRNHKYIYTRHIVIQLDKNRYIDRQAYREIDRQLVRQTESQLNRQIVSQIDTDRQTDRHTD